MSATMRADAGAAGRQFVTFHVRDEMFGVPLGEVQEIIRMPELVQVPLCGASLQGIANLRGVVLPVTSLRRVFGTDEAAHDDATRVVVINRAGAPVGFVVDRMASVITAEADEIEGTESMQTTLHSDLLRGVVKRAAGLIMLLDPARLIAEDLRGQSRQDHGGNASAGLAGGGFAGGSLAGERAERGQAAVIDEVQLVSFEAAGQEYAFPIEDVQEIVQVPGTITQVPQAAPQVVGVMTLRERLLPLVSLRRLFALPGMAVDEHSRIVVVSAGDGGRESVGIVMDTVKEVLRVNRTLIDKVPALLTGGDDGGSAFDSICRLNGGKRLVTVLSAARMFRDTALQSALAAATGAPAQQEASMAEPTRHGRAATGATGNDDEEQFVVFRLAGEEYGVPIEAVQEIVRVPDELTHVPRAASFIEGVVNLRGTVLPVVDQRRRFALDEVERNDRQRIMVLTIAGVRTGFIVDQVSEVLKIPHAAIEPAPALSEEQARLIGRVANLEAQKRMILLLDPRTLLAASEIAAIGAM